MKTIDTIKNFAKRLVMAIAAILMVSNAWGVNWNKITNLSDITSGDSVLVVLQDGKTLTSGKAFVVGAGTTSNSADVTITSNSYISNPATNIRWAMTKSGDNYIFKSSTNKYIGSASTTNANVSGNEESSYSWYITKLSDGYFKVQLTNSTGRYMSWKTTSTDIGKYATSSFLNQISSGAALAQFHGAISFYKKEAAASYAVTYNNGGHGTAPSSTTASSVTLSAITATGWTCTGWKANVNVTNTSTSATITAGTLIANGTNVTLSAATTFTAQWTAKTTTVSFNQNGGDGGQTTSKTATYGQAMPTPITLPTRYGHTFGGYYDGAGGTGTQYYTNTGASARTWDKTSATATLYAKWTEKGLTNYRTTCSTCAAPTTVTVSPVTGTTATINWSGGASDDGYTVVWSTSSDFPASLDGDNSYTVLSNVSSYEITGLDEGETYYVWVVAECDDSQSDRISFTTPIEHTITFNYPDGFTFGGTSPLTVEDGETFTFPTISKPGSGYDCVNSFKGWVAGENYTGQTTFISAGTTSAAVTADATYTAVWVQEDGASEASADDYELVTDEADLVSGAKYLMVGYKSGTYYALGKQASNNRPGVEVTVDDDLITGASVSVATAAGQDSKVYELTLGGSEGAWTFKDVSNQYLYASSGSSNYLKLNASIEATGKTEWVISIEKDGHAAIDTKYYTYDEDGAEDHRGSIFFNTGSTLFACYVKESENPRVYLFKKGGTVSHILTAAPNCDIRLSGDVCITSYNGRGIMAAEPLKVLASGLTASTGYVTLSSNSSDVYFSADRTPNFVKASKPTATLKIMANGSGEIDTDVYVHYKPSNVGTGAASEVVITATPTGGLTAIAQHLIHVRNMAEKFVIAAKLGTTWYALPADFSSSAVQPEAIVIDVDENTMTATASKTAPKNCTYTLWPVKTTATAYDRYEGNGECIRPVTAEGHKGLWATGAASGAGIKNAVTIESLGAGTATESENEQYEWRIYTTITDGKWSYNLQSNQAQQIDKSRYLYLYKGENVRWGTYNSGVSNDLYFLPVTETEPFDMKVVEWYPTKVLIQTNNTLSGDLTVTIGGGDAIASVTYTGKGSKLYEITIPGLANTANATKTMKVSYTADAKTYAACVKVPIIISRTTVDVVNGSSELNAPFSTITPAIYNTADLVVRDGAVLKLNGTKAQNTFFDVTIYPTSKISVPEGKKISVHGLAFFGGIDEIYNGSSYATNKYGVPELSLKGKCGQKTNPTIDYIMRVDDGQMYSLTVPYDVDLADITYWDGTKMGALGSNLWVSAYDGEARANRDMAHTWVWEANFESKFGAAKLKAGVGYTISAEMQSGVGDTYSIIRLPMKSNFTKDNSEAEKSVYVTAYSSASASDNEKGWNLVGNPYMVSISGGEADSKLVLGYLKEVSTGYEWHNDGIRYVTIPHDDGTDYYQQTFSSATLRPFKNFFLQIGTSGDLSFALASRQNAPARYLQTAEREVEFEVLLSNDSRQDNMGLLIADKYSPAYEINADLEKMIGSMSVYTIYGGYNLAYNALSPTDAEALIPVGYVVPAAGDYTFSLDKQGDLDQLEHVYLTDYVANVTTDLLLSPYTFSSATGKIENRFALNVILTDESQTPTNIEEVDVKDDNPQKFIYQGQLYILRGGAIYDATGKYVKGGQQ